MPDRRCPLISLILLAALLTGCAGLPGNIPQQPSRTQPSVVFPVISPTPSPQPTITPTPTITPPPSPTPTPTPLPTCQETTGQIERLEVESAALGEALVVRVYTPPCYDWDLAAANGSLNYPVIYLLHGQGSTDEQWPDLGVPAAADWLITGGEVEPFLVVMPQEESYLQDPSASRFGQALMEDLIPWVDAHYPTCAERDCRSIGGLSRGAAWAVRLGFEHWQTFGAIGAHSLPPFFGDPNRLPTWLAAIPDDQYPRIYLDIGSQDPYLSPAAEFEDLLTHLRVAHLWRLNPGGHDDAYWSGQVEEYLRWYAGN